MRPYFFATLFTLGSLTSTAQKLRYLDWTAVHRLTWNDFKGRPEPASGNAALTSSSIDIKYSITTTGFSYSIQCHFDQDLSWGKVRTAYILSHEQGHFDIAELYARKLNMELKNYKFNNRHAERDINKIYQRVMDEHHRAQKKYDHETNYSRDRTKQHEWLAKINSLLDDNKDYANYKSPFDNRYAKASGPVASSPAHAPVKRKK